MYSMNPNEIYSDSIIEVFILETFTTIDNNILFDLDEIKNKSIYPHQIGYHNSTHHFFINYPSMSTISAFIPHFNIFYLKSEEIISSQFLIVFHYSVLRVYCS